MYAIRIGGGADTVRQYWQARLVDEVHLALWPTLLGQGEALLAGIDLTALVCKCTEHVTSHHGRHVVLSK